jgi:glycosyltransferase involved in cell wall biosynthesis
MNVLLLVNELKYVCGVTNHILHLSEGLTKDESINLWIICGGGNGIMRFSDIDVQIISDERFLHFNRSFFGHISAINFLVKFIRENNIDIIHSHYHYGAAIASRASQLARKVTIQTNHGLLPEMGRLKHFNADNYVAINEHIREHILNKHISEEQNVFFIRCGVPVDEPMPVKSYDSVKIIAASRFVENKGIEDYIEAANEIGEPVRKFVAFHLAGEGPLESEFRELNEKLGGAVKFDGRINDMYPVLRDTNIVVFPGVSENEGFPAIITEAGATGCLLVTSGFMGAHHILEDKTNCLMFSPGDAGELTKILTDSILQKGSMENIASGLYSTVKREFNLDTMINKHIDMYIQCLEK